MSLNFSAEQYDDAYVPNHLSQWEVPKKFQLYPRRLEGCPIAVTDENGHFLDDLKRPTFKEWSSFVGTWGKDFSKPEAVTGTPVKPGIWMIKGKRARWVEAFKVDSEKCMCKKSEQN